MTDSQTTGQTTGVGLRPRLSDLRRKLPIETFVILMTLSLWVVLAVVTPNFLSAENILNIMRQVSISSIIAFGVLFTIIIAGIDLSVGAVAALVGVVVATMINNDVAVALAIPAGLGLGVVIGVVNGLAVDKLGIPPFIVTLAGLQSFRGLALLTTGAQSVSGIPPVMRDFARGVFLGVPNLFLTMAAMGIVLHLFLSTSRTGRYFYAMGSSLEATRRVGINVTRMTVLAYTISALMASVAGILLISRLSVATPTAAMGYELAAIAAVVVGGASLFGGRGTVLGSFVGAVLFVTIGNGANLLGVDPFWEMVVAGLLIAVFVYIDDRQKRRLAGLR